MGRHAAAVGAQIDPVVAAALARRGAGATRHGSGDERQGGPVGWPGRDGDGGPAGSPVGWPGSAAGEPAERTAGTPEAAPAPERPRGWRRLFGGRAA